LVWATMAPPNAKPRECTPNVKKSFEYLGACAQMVTVKNENKKGSRRFKMFDFDASNLRSFDHWTIVEPYFDHPICPHFACIE
ncbi:MAG: hypothetical protein RIS99_1143, partial [Bacteroidota bacterium]